MIITAALIIGIIIGAIFLLSAVYNHVKYKQFGLGGVVLVAFGSMLLGLSIWQSVELSIDAEGNITAKYQYKEDLGAEAAERNNQLEELRLRLAENTEDIDRLKAIIPNASTTQAQEKARKEAQEQFTQNSRYSVLVFNKPAQEETARTLTKALLEKGFKSSATQTALTEAKRQFASNEAWVIYTEGGRSILPDVKQLLSRAAKDTNFIYEPNSSSLRRGDIQVLLF